MSQPVSPLGFSLKVPEGWARRDTPDGASFADKYGRITVIQTTAPKMPTVDAVKQTLLPDLAKSLHAVTVTAVKPAKLPAGRRGVIERLWLLGHLGRTMGACGSRWPHGRGRSGRRQRDAVLAGQQHLSNPLLPQHGNVPFVQRENVPFLAYSGRGLVWGTRFWG